MPASPESVTQKMATIARHIEAHSDERLLLKDLGQLAGLSATHLQRLFKSVFGVSPKAYQNAVRMREFKKTLKTGPNVTDAIYSAGFGSVSRLYGEAQRQVGMKPSAYRKNGEGEHIVHACRQTAVGWLMMAATGKGVCFAEFGDDPDQLLTQLRSEFPGAQLEPSAASHSPELDSWVSALDLYLAARGPRPDVPLDLRGTAFQVHVWQCLLAIREGETINYSDLAERIGKPSAVRAAASACGRNRIAVLVPCHRVLRSDGTLGGYRWGLERKKRLLEQERSLPTVSQS